LACSARLAHEARTAEHANATLIALQRVERAGQASPTMGLLPLEAAPEDATAAVPLQQGFQDRRGRGRWLAAASLAAACFGAALAAAVLWPDAPQAARASGPVARVTAVTPQPAAPQR
jgi:hypothetical protein